VTLEEFLALLARHEDAMEFSEYCAALSPWATFNINRAKHSPFRPVNFYMALTNHRKQQQPAPEPPKRRYALPGERPPSRRTGPDRVIENFDAWTQSRQKR